eukprot:PhF_6_TR1541/c0_g1_i1/m.2812/K19306/BUD23; 18S rRNA (guanine1575-N7)-methyltransferase
MARRPEHRAPPEIVYNEEEANKYLSNSRMNKIQKKMSIRALELLCLPPGARNHLILDIGCGTALSGEIIESFGHKWLGMDISEAMLRVALDRGSSDCVVQHDMGTWSPFRPATFDGAISISAVQWLCNADRREHIPQKRLKAFFASLFTCLRRGARAVLQFYPENVHQTQMITHAAMSSGFGGGLVVDFPHSSHAKKYYLVLMTTNLIAALPTAQGTDPDAIHPESSDNPDSTTSEDDDEEEEEEQEAGEGQEPINPRKRQVQLSERAKRGKDKVRQRSNSKPKSGSKEWIMKKKEQRRTRGDETRPDTKYTGRRRRA